ncbi:hypothetical protein [Deinococcus sp.]|uniref:hypothetical protein n=1 Tax=Deinococcus sp. TaxID=47478 RepID=UPI003C7C5D24
MSAPWTLHGGHQQVLGAIGLRLSPAHGAEVMGGAFAGPAQHEAAVALLTAVLVAQPWLYAYAEAHLLPVEALEAAGLRQVSAYTRMSGPLPADLPSVPEGFRIVPLSEVESLPDRLAAQQTYSDMIGHTIVPPEFVLPGAGGCDEGLSRLAYDPSGAAVGICRVWRDGVEVACTTPGVRPALRASGLRRALLLSVCAAARAAGAARLKLEAWGDSEEQRAEDMALGLSVEVVTPIYSA